MIILTDSDLVDLQKKSSRLAYILLSLLITVVLLAWRSNVSTLSSIQPGERLYFPKLCRQYLPQEVTRGPVTGEPSSSHLSFSIFFIFFLKFDWKLKLMQLVVTLGRKYLKCNTSRKMKKGFILIITVLFQLTVTNIL